MTAILLALTSGLSWGAADFLGGQRSRIDGALTVLIWSQLISGAALTLGLLAFGPDPTRAALAGGALAGAAGAVGLLAFYRAMTIGAISLVTPISACGVIVTVLVALARGEDPGAWALLGVAIAIGGIVLVSISPAGDAGDAQEPAAGGATARPTERLSREALVLSLLAAFAFSMFFVLIDHAADRAGTTELWVTAAARGGSLLTLCGVLCTGRAKLAWPGARAMPIIATIGLLDLLANSLMAFATTRGNLAIVSVLGSLYPAAAVLLARVVLGERLARSQDAGIVLALLGVALMAGTR